MANLQVSEQTPTASSSSPLSSPPHPAKGLAQVLGIHPAIAAVTFATDQMLFTGELATGGLGMILSLPVSVAIGFLTFMAQKSWYGDTADSAAIKGGLVGLIAAIPTSLPMLLYVPMGALGFFRRKI